MQQYTCSLKRHNFVSETLFPIMKKSGEILIIIVTIEFNLWVLGLGIFFVGVFVLALVKILKLIKETSGGDVSGSPQKA